MSHETPRIAGAVDEDRVMIVNRAGVYVVAYHRPWAKSPVVVLETPDPEVADTFRQGFLAGLAAA